jgi:hypothetical protein
MYLEAENVRDTIYIEGTPTIEMTIKSTDMGDVAAAGLLVNMSPLVHQARAGLLTMIDLPLPHWQHEEMPMPLNAPPRYPQTMRHP